jgi:hypothetical protein
MNTIPLLQRVLGDDWDKLAPVIQRHYQLNQAGNISSAVHGTMYVHYPAFAKPMVLIARLMGALLDIKNKDLKATVNKWIATDSQTLFWRREIQSPDGKTTIFASQMEYQCDNELIEFVRFGFGIRLKIYVENGQLIYQSNGHLWRCGLVTIPIPDVLFLGHSTIIEKPINAEHFELDFKIVHPLFGLTYQYGGLFHYER